MSWLIAIGIVFVGVVVVCMPVLVLSHLADRDDILAEFRQLNSSLLMKHFGARWPTGQKRWHRILSGEENEITIEGILWGLRQVFLVEDESGRHWRVVVAHERGADPVLQVQELGNS